MRALLLTVGLAFLGGPALAGGARLRASHMRAELALSSRARVAPAIGKVITMLKNLVAEMDAEQAQDEKNLEAFTAWYTEQHAATSSSIDALKTSIENFKATLEQLYAQKDELETKITFLNGEIETTNTQINQATEKRQEENTAYVAEQQDFANSIAACQKAIDILKKHYGDGTTKQAEKPGFMSLAQTAVVIRRGLARNGGRAGAKVQAFLQAVAKGKGPFDTYQASTGEGLNIVDEMGVLSQTFSEDKQAATEEEARLQSVFENLMKEKTEALNTLTSERDSQQAVLNDVNQQIGENESQLAAAEAELENEQAYLSTIEKQNKDTHDLFEMRKHDRALEKEACEAAMKVLGGESFLQLSSSTKVVSQHKARSLAKSARCPTCPRAMALLRSAAQKYHSQLLATATALTLSGSALSDVIAKLENLIVRIDEDQKMEDEHKAWCETEMSTTQAKKAKHEGLVAELTQKIADTTELIAEKKTALQENADATKAADDQMATQRAIRAKEQEEYEVELQNYKDAIDALNQAIDILSKFYGGGGEGFVQVDDSADAAPRAASPETFGAYAKKGGSGIVEMISQTRKEFEIGKADMMKAEEEAVKDFQATEAAYVAARDSLVAAKNQLTVELQTAEANLESYTEDKATNENEVASAVAYLGQLSRSCDTLLEKYDERVALRNDEKKAINEAIDVLKEVE